MSSNSENIPPQVIKRILKEINEITSEPIEGIKLISNEQDICDIQAIIDGPAGTPYEGGYFRVKLILCKGFPSQPPKGFFITKIFHPNVATNGEICVNTLKKDWKPDLGIKHVLLTVKCLLIVPNPESALNEEAGKLLLEDYDEYFSRAKLYTEVHARHLLKTLPNSSDNLYASTITTVTTTTTTSTNPLDSNKSLNNNQNITSTTDEPNMKIAKMSSSQATSQSTASTNANKKNDKKKALKRL